MEKEPFFGVGWSSTGSPMAPSEQPPPQCFYGLSWDQQQPPHMSQDAHFESALSSLVSSPTSNPLTGAGDSVAIMELIGRLGSICNPGDVSPTSRYRSTNTSCYSTPLNSPPRLSTSMVELLQNRANGSLTLPNPMPSGQLFAPFAADPAFAERAARYSCFSGRSYGDISAQYGLPEAGKLSRVSSSQYLKASGGASQLAVPGSDGMEMPAVDAAQLEMEMTSKLGSRTSGDSTPEETELGSGMEEPAAGASNKMMAHDGDASLRSGNDSSVRKRKAAPKNKTKEAPLASSTSNSTKKTEGDNSDTKRCKPTETNGPATGKPKAEETGDSAQIQGKDNNAKPPEPLKDYIHVRARRGQATDSHSLAERVRREKISERMKFLQDLVPGCNKLTGKAVMLDEIINYVQSLQRQVEFLSMKLATVNPQLEFNLETVLPKEMNDCPRPVYPLESAAMPFPQGNPLQSIMHTRLETQRSLGPQESSLQRSLSMQLPSLHAFDTSSQVPNLPSFWEDDLQSVVRMGFGQSQETDFSSQNLEGQLPASHMKIEL